MASGPITSWEIDGETVEMMSDFIFWGSKITVDGDCSHAIKRHSLEGKLWPTLMYSVNQKKKKQELHIRIEFIWSLKNYNFPLNLLI